MDSQAFSNTSSFKKNIPECVTVAEIKISSYMPHLWFLFLETYAFTIKLWKDTNLTA